MHQSLQSSFWKSLSVEAEENQEGRIQTACMKSCINDWSVTDRRSPARSLYFPSAKEMHSYGVSYVVTLSLFCALPVGVWSYLHAEKADNIVTLRPCSLPLPSSNCSCVTSNSMRKSAGQDLFKKGHTARQQAVVRAFRHAWKGYKTYAWGHDELKPLSKTFGEWFGLGLTLVDALDTIWLMGLREEFQEARDWVAEHMNVAQDVYVNLFETTIRVLGGLLSAYHLSKDDVFLEKAVALADNLLPSFNSPTGIPFSDVNLLTHAVRAPEWTPESSIAEVTTVQLEFREISRLTRDSKYQAAVDRAMDHVQSQPLHDGLVHMLIDPTTGKLKTDGTLTLGARADSYYEYLLKQWLQTNRTDPRFLNWYKASVMGIERQLMRHSSGGLLFIGELLNGREYQSKMDHLVCFLPGLLALGASNGVESKRHLLEAQSLMETCYAMYSQMATGLSAELVYFDDRPGEDFTARVNDKHNLLRPEAVESLFILYRLTGNTTYQDWGWEIFQAFERFCRVATGGYTSIDDVTSTENPTPLDKMESFFLAETLKYLFLLFGDDNALPLNQFVLNTEAHPLPIFSPQ